jgi:hypothetical protein
MSVMTSNMFVPEVCIKRFDVWPISEKFMNGTFLMHKFMTSYSRQSIKESYYTSQKNILPCVFWFSIIEKPMIRTLIAKQNKRPYPNYCLGSDVSIERYKKHFTLHPCLFMLSLYVLKILIHELIIYGYTHEH